MTNTISIKLVCHSVVKQVLGQGELEVLLPANATGLDLEKRVLKMAGGRLKGVPFRLAVNLAFVSRETVLSQGDEVSLIPPMQGG